MKSLFAAALLLPLLITALPAQEVSGDTVLHSYDIGDLTRRLVERNWAAGKEEKTSGERRDRAGEEVAEIVQRLMQGAMINAGKAPKRVENAAGEVLLVEATPLQQEWCADFLRTWQAQVDKVIVVRAQILEVPAATFEKLGLPAKPTTLKSDGALEELLSRCRAAKGVSYQQSPVLVAFNGQRARIAIQSRVAYVERYQAYEMVEPMHRSLVVPVIGTVQEGLSWDLLPVTIDERTLAIESKLTLSDVERPLATLESEHGEICVPKVTKLSIETTVLLGDDVNALFSTAEHMGRRCVVFLHARRAAASELGRLIDQPDKKKK